MALFALPLAGFADTAAVPLFRIFLKDGTALVSYGEFARAVDRVAFSVPVGAITANPKLHVVSIPAASVDWEKTDAYAAAVRAQHYARTRGEDDYALLLGRVTTALNDLGGTTDPARRLTMAEEARRNLAAWPAANYGYKAREVAQLVALFDDAIIELRGAAGYEGFDLSLVAMTDSGPTVELMRTPDARSAIELAYRAAMLANDPEERTALLRELGGALAAAPPDATWSVPLRARVTEALAAEARADKAYADLAAQAAASASARAARGDVRGLQDIIARVLRSDESLGRKRPGVAAALLATLDQRLAEARRVRLAADARALRLEVLLAYRQAIDAPVQRMASFSRWLKDIRDHAGPDPKYLRPLMDRARLAHLELTGVTPPAEARESFQLLSAALHMTRHAASLRRDAVQSNDSKIAWDASAAAAGALTLGERAAAELHRLISSQPIR